MDAEVCPACGAEGALAAHGRYWKYYYAEQIEILRVRCRRCGVTHALMPAFSLPGTSIGTVEAEQYLLARAEGVGRGGASARLRELALSSCYPKQLDRMFEVAVERAKALFANTASRPGNPMGWVQELVGATDTPLLRLNRFCLANHYNCLCFCRASIITFGCRSAGGGISHNDDGSGTSSAPIGSGKHHLRRRRQ